MIVYGTQYYRPPYPASDHWKSDLEKIQRSNFNTVKLWAVWSWIERKEGRFYFDDLDGLVADCAEAGLNVVINIIPEGMPYWLSRQHADAKYQTQDRRRIEVGGAANLPSGGSPGVCPDKPEVSQLTSRFIRAVVERYAPAEYVVAFDVWNEPHIEPIFDYPESLFCYCPHSQAEFIGWLKRKYADLEQLNQAWARAYASWEDVLPPARFGTYADMIDWRIFWIENLRRWLEQRVAAAKPVSRGKTVMTHVPFSGYIGGIGEGGLGQHLGDEFVLAGAVDKFGLTSFPKWLMGNDFVQHLVNIELVASASQLAGVEFWQSELQGGAGKWEARGRSVATAEEIRLWNWSAIAGGAKGVMYWQWNPEPSGLEAPGFGLTTLAGELSERTRAAAECAAAFNCVPGFDQAERVPAVNGIFVSRSADLFLHAAALGEGMYAKGLYGAYRACFDRGVPVRFVHADELQNGALHGLRVLYAPVCLALSQAEIEGLKRFVREGGMLVADAGLGLFNEKGIIPRDNGFLEELFGAAGLEVDHVDPVRIRLNAAPDGADEILTGRYYRVDFERIQPEVTVHGRFADGQPAVIENRYGKGRAILSGSLVSLGVGLDGDRQTGEFISGWMDPDGYAGIHILENRGNLLLRVHRGEEGIYLSAVNYSELDQTLRLGFAENWSMADDPAKFAPKTVLRDNCLEFQVGSMNGMLIKLKKG